MEGGFASAIEYMGSVRDAEIFVKRDDLIPFSYGGNKVRIAAEVFRDIRETGCTSVISYGSAGSNLNRAVADFAAEEGLPCYVIIKQEELKGGEVPAVTMNERLLKRAGARVTRCTGAAVRETVERVLATSRAAGERPYYIYGDSTGQGNTRTLMRASHKEYLEIAEYERKEGIGFDHIFLAVGTGMTAAGLLAGYILSGDAMRMGRESLSHKAPGRDICTAGERPAVPGGGTYTAEKKSGAKCGGDYAGEGRTGRRDISGYPRFCGISVAREAAAEMRVIEQCLREYGIEDPGTGLKDFKLTDDYLCGGYGRHCPEMLSMISRIYKDCGTGLDPTYTGKAAYGMAKEIEREHITGNCLFIHTGGLPGFLDKKSLIC